jgi:very-short-patch-repair endonuclease
MGTWQKLLEEQQGVATRAQLRAAGLGRHALDRCVAAGDLRRLPRAVYTDRPAPTRARYLLSGGRCDEGFAARVRTALLQLGPGARAARRTAAALWRLDMLVEPDDVELDVPHGSRRRVPGVRVQQSRSSAQGLVVPVPGCAPLPVTPLVDTVLDCAVDRPLLEAVAIADSALRRRDCSVKALRRAATARRGLPHNGRVWAVLRLLDARCGSVLESALRVVLHNAGLAPPRTQYAMLAAGLMLGRVDFAWPVERLVVETDGRRWHDPADRRHADRQRDNRWGRLGWLVLRFTWAEVIHDPDAVVAAVREALATRR